MPGKTKDQIVDILEDIALLLEIKGDNPFKIRAYQNGARTLDSLEEELNTVIAEERLDKIKGIGSALVDKIQKLYLQGTLPFYDDLKASVPAGLLEMTEIPGLGGKKIKALHTALGITTIAELTAAAEDGRIAELKGFGKKSAEKILTGIKNREAYNARHIWWDARAVADEILAGLQEVAEVERVEAAGSLRRGKETVGDLDFIAASDHPEPIMEWFVQQDQVVEVTAQGQTKSSIRLDGGLQADLRVVPPAQFAFALHHFTGSKEHNVLMRQRALSRGYSLSEWGLSPKDEDSDLPPIHADNEASLFDALNLPYIVPELREGRGEIEAAEAGHLPELINENDLRGTFHNHTTASDGKHTLDQMVAGAEARGWEYVGFADHSKASFQANGLDDQRVLKQIEAVEALRSSGKYKIHVFTGIECDILTDGRLDLEESTLEKLDYVVSSVHAALGQDEKTMTARIIRAIEHPCTTMLGHLTGRLLLRREPSQLDARKIIDAAIANQVIIELNANPWRLDMDWRLWRSAAEKGLKTSINPDAHSVEGYDFVRSGVLTARKGWLTKDDVINTYSLEAVKSFL
ncbi:MAG: DNA polymerase/3'-5' exonuclease PolX [Opitutales bacterium]|nr:DNA polymerase/3'-5' exonuclease PolX [Opitutales bacterium]NRA25625.1 DNA polymerase/3'-5' exonuclease PolX [Opitutales bacterium]